mgnify:CR=1 FL=1
MSEDKIVIIISKLSIIGSDLTVPKNVRTNVKKAISALEENGKEQNVKIDKALEALSDVDNDPNIPSYTRSQIWGVISELEVQA